MAVALRYANKRGCVVEWFMDIKHIASTSALSMKNAIEELFSTHGVSISRLCRQSYDRDSNMQGELNGLKTLILRENECAYYVHYFAHQLQLALVAIAKNHVHIVDFFVLVSNIVTVVGASCKRRDVLREKRAAQIIEALSLSDITSEKSLNQETTLIRASDTRWESHYGTLLSLVNMFESVIDVLDVVAENATASEQKLEAFRLLKGMQSFEFVFNLHLMKSILGIMNDLSQALQRKDQDIVNAMTQVQVSKQRLQSMRDSGWSNLIDEISDFCGNNTLMFLAWKIRILLKEDQGVELKKRQSLIIIVSRFSIR